MAKCLELAKLGELDTAPNPMVGCVIVHQDTIVSKGYHAKYGEAHAEVNAFNNLDAAINTEECEVYVNLEPCSHYGKTPPCADLIVAKNPKRLVIGMLDPNTKVAGKGLKKVLEAGIDVKVGVLEDACKELNKKFIKAHTSLLPYVTLKWAETKNGYMAQDRNQVKISSPENDSFVHHLRATHQAILVGAGTIKTDNPRLDVRHVKGKNPIKVILSKDLSVDNTNYNCTSETLIYNKDVSKQEAFCEYIALENLSIESILKDLHARGIHSVLVEGGPTILAAFVKEKIWDESIILKSSKEWTDGIKAPWLGIPSYKEVKQHDDLIKYFIPR